MAGGVLRRPWLLALALPHIARGVFWREAEVHERGEDTHPQAHPSVRQGGLDTHPQAFDRGAQNGEAEDAHRYAVEGRSLEEQGKVAVATEIGETEGAELDEAGLQDAWARIQRVADEGMNSAALDTEADSEAAAVAELENERRVEETISSQLRQYEAEMKELEVERAALAGGQPYVPSAGLIKEDMVNSMHRKKEALKALHSSGQLEKKARELRQRHQEISNQIRAEEERRMEIVDREERATIWHKMEALRVQKKAAEEKEAQAVMQQRYVEQLKAEERRKERELAAELDRARKKDLMDEEQFSHQSKVFWRQQAEAKEAQASEERHQASLAKQEEEREEMEYRQKVAVEERKLQEEMAEETKRLFATERDLKDRIVAERKARAQAEDALRIEMHEQDLIERAVQAESHEQLAERRLAVRRLIQEANADYSKRLTRSQEHYLRHIFFEDLAGNISVVQFMDITSALHAAVREDFNFTLISEATAGALTFSAATYKHQAEAHIESFVSKVVAGNISGAALVPLTSEFFVELGALFHTHLMEAQDAGQSLLEATPERVRATVVPVAARLAPLLPVEAFASVAPPPPPEILDAGAGLAPKMSPLAPVGAPRRLPAVDPNAKTIQAFSAQADAEVNTGLDADANVEFNTSLVSADTCMRVLALLNDATRLKDLSKIEDVINATARFLPVLSALIPDVTPGVVALVEPLLGAARAETAALSSASKAVEKSIKPIIRRRLGCQGSAVVTLAHQNPFFFSGAPAAGDGLRRMGFFIALAVAAVSGVWS